MGNDPGERMAELTLILLISAALGTLMRSSMQVFQNQVIYVSEMINELTVSVLLAFSLLVLYLAGGILYDGESLEVTPENFRRIATAVSALALAAGFLIEPAASEVRRRLGQVMRR